MKKILMPLCLISLLVACSQMSQVAEEETSVDRVELEITPQVEEPITTADEEYTSMDEEEEVEEAVPEEPEVVIIKEPPVTIHHYSYPTLENMYSYPNTEMLQSFQEDFSWDGNPTLGEIHNGNFIDEHENSTLMIFYANATVHTAGFDTKLYLILNSQGEIVYSELIMGDVVQIIPLPTTQGTAKILANQNSTWQGATGGQTFLIDFVGGQRHDLPITNLGIEEEYNYFHYENDVLQWMEPIMSEMSAMPIGYNVANEFRWDPDLAIFTS